jgi:hypothetical protein
MSRSLTASFPKRVGILQHCFDRPTQFSMIERRQENKLGK